MTVLGVVVAAALGAVLRHLVATGSRDARTGVLVANVVGSLLLGLLVGWRLAGDLSGAALTVLGTGFCGALTTWSAFALAVGTEVDDGRRRDAAVHVAVTLLLGLAAAALGLALTGAL